MKIYVFDTDEGGYHNTPSARNAVNKAGAEKNKGFGIQGNSFAIPVLDRKNKPLTLTKIMPGIRKFIRYAKDNPNDEFIVSSIGVDSVKYPKDIIAPFFVDYPSNVSFIDNEYSDCIPAVSEYPIRLLVASSRNFKDIKLIFEVKEKLTHFYNLKELEYIPVSETFAGRIMNGYNSKHNVASMVIKTQWDRMDLPVMTPKENARGTINSSAYFDKLALCIANSTDLLLFDDYRDKDIFSILKLVDGIGINQIHYFGSQLDTTNQRGQND